MSDEVITSGSFPVRLSQIGGAAKCGLCSPSKAMMRELWFSNSTDYKWIACHNAVKAHPHLTVHHLIRSTYVNIHLCQRPFQTSSACPSAILLTCTAQTFHQQSLLKIWLLFHNVHSLQTFLPQVVFAPWPLEKVLRQIHQDKIKLWILYLLFSLETWS